MYILTRFTTNIFNISKILGPIRLSTRYKITKYSYATKDITKTMEKTEEDNPPIKYMASPASKWKAQTSRTGVADPRLWYEPYVILASLSVFMIYFCILREENQIDKELERTLYSRIAGLEEHQLQASLDHNRQHGLSTTDLEARLKELGK